MEIRFNNFLFKIWNEYFNVLDCVATQSFVRENYFPKIFYVNYPTTIQFKKIFGL